jgi:AcrR family transcriptional regulator
MSAHPTTIKLIEAFLTLADAQGVDRVTVQDVLRESRVAKGSLYHHFGTFDHLIAAALAQKYAEGVDRSIALINEVLRRSTTKQEFRAAVRWLVEQTSGIETAAFRISRAKIIGKCATNGILRRRVGEEQARLSATLEAFLAEWQAHSWVRENIDVPAAALLIQAYTFGKVIDDIALQPVEPEAWLALIEGLFESLFLSKD